MSVSIASIILCTFHMHDLYLVRCYLSKYKIYHKIDQMLLLGCDFPLYIANFLLCNILVGPLVVCYWQGTWRILDNFAYINNKQIYFWVTFLIGFLLAFITSFAQGFFTRTFVDKSNFIFVPVSRVFTYVSAFSGVHYWYGIWNLVDLYTGRNLPSAVSSIFVGVTLLGGLRVLRNVVGAPFIISIDLDKDHYFKANTRFKCEPVIGLKFAGDVLLTVIIGGLITIIWRGTFELFDFVLFPNNTELTIEFSFVIYVSISLFIQIVQVPAKIISQYLDEKKALILKIIFENFIMLIAFTGCVCCWRGMWVFLDNYFLTDNKKLAAWSAHLIGYFGLSLCMISQSVLMKGCVLDGELINGDGLSFPTRVLHKMKQFCKHFREMDDEDDVEGDTNRDNSDFTETTDTSNNEDSNKSHGTSNKIKSYGSVSNLKKGTPSSKARNLPASKKKAKPSEGTTNLPTSKKKTNLSEGATAF